MKKKFFSLLMAGVVMGLFSCAPQGHFIVRRGNVAAPRPVPAQNPEPMVIELGLNARQTKKFNTVRKEMQSNNANQKLSPAEVQKRNTQSDNKMKKILTNEQYQKYQTMQQQPKGNGAQPQGNKVQSQGNKAPSQGNKAQPKGSEQNQKKGKK